MRLTRWDDSRLFQIDAGSGTDPHVSSRRRYFAIAMALFVGALAIAGCTAAAGNVAPPSPPHPLSRRVGRHTSRRRASTAKASASAPAALGATLTVDGRSGATLSVTVESVIDPASGVDPLSIPQVGRRFVGVVFEVTGSGVTNDLNADTTVVGTDGKRYIYLGIPIAECSNFAFGPIALQDGSPIDGCVTFGLPEGVDVAYVEFAPSGARFASHLLRWATG